MVKEMSNEDMSTEEDDTNKFVDHYLLVTCQLSYIRLSCQRGDMVMVGTTSRYFCGEGRCGSPFCK